MFEQYKVIRNAEMREYTTLKLGGAADWLAEPESEEEIIGLMREARENGIPITVIGHGSNLLVLDGGIRGLVIRIGRGLSKIRREENTLHVQAGAMMGTAAAAAADEGLSGLEFAAGIPGTVGGGAVMNAGAYGGEMAQVVTSVRGILPGGEAVTMNADELDYGYRHSSIPQKGLLITEVSMSLTPGNTDEIRARMTDFNARRAEKQPLDVPSAGSTFKRPDGAFAAALIDQCGLKGYTVGKTRVSPKNAGFLVNKGDSAADYLRLVKEVQRIVEQRTGIRLEPEIRILGEQAVSDQQNG